VTSFGVSFNLSASHPDLLQDARAFLPLGCDLSASASPDLRYSLQGPASVAGGTPYLLRRNGRKLFTSVHRQELLEHFHSVVSLDVAERSSNRSFVHAGVVGWSNFAILMPGRSFAGKSTLVAALLRAGATYFSDEFAVIDHKGRVHPYPRPLQIREAGSHHQTSHPVEEFGARAASKPLTVKLILVTRFNPEARWRPRPLSPGIGLLKLLDNTVSARRSPAAALHNLKNVVSQAETVRSPRGEASQIVDWLTSRFGPAKGSRKTT
jgi:hypothetical protein